MLSEAGIIKSQMFFDLSEMVVGRDITTNEFEWNYDTNHYPKRMKLAELMDVSCGDIEVVGKARNLVQTIENKYNVNCQLCVYYPPDGFIDWHTNENLPTYNALCTYSHTGHSFFQYKEKDETITVPDNIGWSVKKTKWSKDEPVWHRAVSNNERITIAFSSKNENQIDALIKDIT